MKSFAEVYLSTADGKTLFSEQEKVEIKISNGEVRDGIVVDSKIKYQEIDGFGASFTDSSAYLINQILNPNYKTELMNKLFSENVGIGLSFIRQTIGACDFSRYEYNYLEEDKNIESFTIDHDLTDIIPLLIEANKINSELKFMASPWSPPGWMKTSGKMIGGKLKEENYDIYAKYIANYITEYKKSGIYIFAVTPQNEPLYSPGHYPGMLFEASEEANFIKNYLRPSFELNNLDIKILCYDHNWDCPEYPIEVLEKAEDFVDGVAWHLYNGDVEAQSLVRNRFPNKDTYFTEGSGGEWVPPFKTAFFNLTNIGINTLRNWSKSFVLWNFALDEKNGPMPVTDDPTCRGVVTVNSVTGELIYNLDYYVLSHFSKFIRPGALRVDSNNYGGIINVACENKDGSVVIVVSNEGEADKLINISVDNFYFEYEMKKGSVVTFKIEK